ncbi:MAG: DNA mismatch repair protein MutS [Niabella sp.]
MQIDETSFNDIAIFQKEEEFSIFHKLNFTRTAGGKAWLHKLFSTPFDNIERIKGTQNIIRKLTERVEDWPTEISNGTMLVMDKFLDYPLDSISNRPTIMEAQVYRILHYADFSMIRFSVKHFIDFFQGLKQVLDILQGLELPVLFTLNLDRIRHLLQVGPLNEMSQLSPHDKISHKNFLFYAVNLRIRHKHSVQELMNIYYQLDAWYSMALAVRKFNLCFPEFVESDTPLLEAKGLFHLQLQDPVPYDLEMNPQHNFLFLTGANMAGKSTLIKSVGSAVFLAHIGMGVPAAQMQLTMFDGLISNINVVDNIAKGESFFFNEVQRIKKTVGKVTDGKKWLVLIDELFKGTNIQDAMRCSLAVIKGLLKVKGSLFILSTHLYEIGEELKDSPNISFRHFETKVTEDSLSFSYQLKEGISKDRLGYLILKREKVVDLLEGL